MSEGQPLYSHIPIPTYDEAVSASPQPSSQHHLGPSEISDDAERQSFLPPGRDRRQRRRRRRRENNGYQSPSARSRSSEDTLDGMVSDGSEDTEGEDEALRRDIEEMEMMDADGVEGSGEAGRRNRRLRQALRSRFGKRMGWLGSTLSEIRLPRVAMPSMEWVTRRMPQVNFTIPERYRPGWQIMARLFGLFIIIGLMYALFVLEIIPRVGGAFPYDTELIRSFAQGSVDAASIRENLRHITSYAHVAGTEGDFFLAEWIENAFKAEGLQDVEMKEYQVYLNYPTKDGRAVSIVEPKEMAWQAKLEEDTVYQNPSPQQENTMVFHGHSRTGTAQGPLIYANYGSREDFKRIADSGVDMNGTIALVRYGGTQGDRALKVKAAEDWGVKGVLIYSDPAEDGFGRGKEWPEGRWRTSDSVQRGAVSLMSWVIGDVLTPGWASTPDADRKSRNNNPGLVNIPSLPLAWRDAQHLLQALKGHGKEAPKDWQGAVPDVQWFIGDKSSPVVKLQNEQFENDKQPIWNVMGNIRGVEQPQKRVVVGNHRDSWCFGAADPGSGTAIMLEVIRILGVLREKGWRPRRTITFASWDAEEYNLIGSTEYVEENLDMLRTDGIAYLNVDVGVVGDNFRAAASPALKQALTRVLKRVGDPVRNVTLYELWEKNNQKLEGLGAGSDYVAFQDMAGTSSMDIGFEGPGFPYHSCYETFEWMEKFGDPGFQYHETLAQVWVLLILEVSQEAMLPMDITQYAEGLKSYAQHTLDYARSKGAPEKDGAEVKFDMQGVFDAIDSVKSAADIVNRWTELWYGTVMSNGGIETTAMIIQRQWFNGKIANFETDLLDIPWSKEEEQEQHGIPGREQFKHIVFGPQLWSAYDEAYFPAIRDAVDAGDWKLAQAQVEKAARIINRAADELRPS